MCGRYAFALQPLGPWSAVFRAWMESMEPRYNIAPTSTIPVFTAAGWHTMRWGLIPAWSKESTTRYATFNARAESLKDKPAYRTAWKQRQRCLMPALGYYEWKKQGNGKTPYFIRSSGNQPLVFAGLWDRWQSERKTLLSSTIITCPAIAQIEELHPRMPFLLTPQAAEEWLHGSIAACDDLLKQPPAVALNFYPVDQRVGNVHNTGEELTQPA